MTIESLVAEIEFVLPEEIELFVARAALIDFIRALHELMVKSGQSHETLFSEVQNVFGSTTAHHLKRVIPTSLKTFKSNLFFSEAPLTDAIVEICRGRRIPLDDGLALFSHFIKALDEERFDKKGNCESALVMVYRAVGGEAAFHLGGLNVGDALLMATTECQYLDYRLSALSSYVKRWEMEHQWAIEGNK